MGIGLPWRLIMALTFKTRKRCSRALHAVVRKKFICSDTKSSDDSTDEVHNLDNKYV